MKGGEGTTYSGHGVESDGLEADEVVARGHARRDRRRPGRVVGDHLARAPEPVADRAVDQPGLIDLEPLGVRSVKLVACGPVAHGHIGHNRAGIVGPLRTTMPI